MSEGIFAIALSPARSARPFLANSAATTVTVMRHGEDSGKWRQAAVLPGRQRENGGLAEFPANRKFAVTTYRRPRRRLAQPSRAIPAARKNPCARPQAS